MNSIRVEATKLRRAGYSYAMISSKLSVPKSTLSGWFSDFPFTPNKIVLRRIQFGPIKSGAKRHSQRMEETRLLREQGIKELGKLSNRDLWLLGIGLYIGEGTKATEQIQVVNSDPRVIKMVIRWLRECCSLDLDNLTIALHVYPDTNKNEAIRYWEGITGISRKNFRQTIIDKRINKSRVKHNSLPYGTVDLRVKSNNDPTKGVRLSRRLRGWLEGALSQANNAGIV